MLGPLVFKDTKVKDDYITQLQNVFESADVRGLYAFDAAKEMRDDHEPIDGYFVAKLHG